MIAVFGVGSIFIFQTLELQQNEWMYMLAIILLSITSMFSTEFFVFSKHMAPIKRIYQKDWHTLEELEIAYSQVERFPLLTVKRIMLPHFLGLAIPASTLFLIFHSFEFITTPVHYVWYAWVGAFLVALLHALIEFFLTFQAIRPLLIDLYEKGQQQHKVELSSYSSLYISLKRKLLAGSLFLALFPILLFSMASHIRLSISDSEILADYWKWSGLLITVITLLAFYGTVVIFKNIEVPVKQLKESFQNVEKGNLTFISNTYSDEFSHLFSGFNHMVSAIQQRDEANQKLLEQFFAVVAGTLDARDPYTAGHSKRVAAYSVLIAKQMNWSSKEIDMLRKSALLHDIGKIGVRDAVLLKDGKLSDEEFAQIKQHPVIGANILKGVDLGEDLLPILPGVEHHHERYDGKGYPAQLSGEDIPVLGRLIAVADAYDAMTSDRPYRKGMPQEKALSILEDGMGTQWDPVFTKAFLSVMRGNKVMVHA